VGGAMQDAHLVVRLDNLVMEKGGLNLFVSLRLSNVSKLKEFHSDVARNHFEFSKALVDVRKAHITLFMVNGRGNAPEDAIAKLNGAQTVVAKHFPTKSPSFNLMGVGTFDATSRNKDKIIFAIPKLDNQMLAFRNELLAHFDELAKPESRSWIPHVTLIKEHKQIVPFEVYRSFVDTDFGTQSNLSLELNIVGSVAEDGYYKRLASIKL